MVNWILRHSDKGVQCACALRGTVPGWLEYLMILGYATYTMQFVYASICWLLPGSEPDNSQQMDAYELIHVG